MTPGKVKCNLQVETSKNGNTGSVYEPGCEVTFESGGASFCIVKVQPDGNKELSAVKLEKLGASELDIESNVTNISSTVQEGMSLCKTLGLEASQKTGDFKTEGTQLVLEGVTLTQ